MQAHPDQYAERAKGQRIIDIAGIVQLAGRMLHRIGDERTAKAIRELANAADGLHRLGMAIREGGPRERLTAERSNQGKESNHVTPTHRVEIQSV